MTQKENSIIDTSRRTLEDLYNLNPQEPSSSVSEILGKFRILTREKTLTSDILNEKCLKTLVRYSSECQIEAQKCLSNLILNYPHLREGLVEPYVVCVEQRFAKILGKAELSSDNKEKEQKEFRKDQCEVLYYDLRIIFLLSALCAGLRNNIRDRLFCPLLEFTLNEAEQLGRDNYLLVIESLKTLFNLTMDKCLDTDLMAKVILKLFSFVDSLEETISCTESGTKLDHTDQLLVNLIHLLTNMPEQIYLKLSNDDSDKVLNHLDEKLKTFTKQSFRETVLPALNTCANICRHKEDVRQRWFDIILKSTTEFEKRPEEYDTLRGRLVKLMTSVDVHIKDIAAEFLHALCGGDTDKFITYTGFGNSAAFLSTKGLLSQCNTRGINSAASYLEDGRTREKDYQDLRGKLDPITGKLEQPRKDPMEGMSEEEKEWHAQKLAESISKLSNLGIIKPMQVTSNGEVSELNLQESSERSGHV